MITVLQILFLTITKSASALRERETENCCKIVCTDAGAFVFQEELLTDLEAHLEEDDDQGTSVSSTTHADRCLTICPIF